MHAYPRIAFATLLLALVFIAGCDDKKSTQRPTQVAAKVNADEITVHQVNNLLTQRTDIQPEAAALAKRAALETLVNQQLARQKAIDADLDRSPEVIQAIEAAKTEILARAHLEGITQTLLKPSAEEIQIYYSKHPELFARRRVFSLETIAFVANGDAAAEAHKQLSKSLSMKQAAEWLQSHGIKFAANRGVRAAEQIPLVLLPKVQAMKKSEIELFEDNNGRFQLIRVVDFLEAPVSEASAKPRIYRFLWNLRSREAIAREMNEIRKKAKIEYFGEFAKHPAAAKAPDKAAAQVKSFNEGEARTEVESQPKPEVVIK